jgi:2-phosphosulfolactate phosphatase
MAEEYLRVHTLPQNVGVEDLAESTVVVIDVLRATTTICQAVASGATEVVPFCEVAEARAAAEKAERDKVVLGGERRGVRIEGFDLGNSPAEYTPDAAGDRAVYLTTTNGTQALHQARLARRVIIGAIVNLSAVVESVMKEPRIDILCAGTGGEESLEDILAAGAIVERLNVTPLADWEQNEAAKSAAREWRTLVDEAHRAGHSIESQLADQFRDTLGGRNCFETGNEADLRACARIDHVSVAPELDTKSWRITAIDTQNGSR